MKQKLAALAISLTAMAGPALACPGADAMTGDGVWIATDDGGKIHYQRTGDDRVVETAEFPGDDIVVTDSHLGIFFVKDGTVKDGEVDPDTVTRWEFPEKVEFPDPNSAGIWSEMVDVFVPGATSPFQDRLTVRRSGASKTTIGECPYRARSITVTLTSGNGSAWQTEYTYLLELGIGILVAAGEARAAPEFEFVPVAISEGRP